MAKNLILVAGAIAAGIAMVNIYFSLNTGYVYGMGFPSLPF